MVTASPATVRARMSTLAVRLRRTASTAALLTLPAAMVIGGLAVHGALDAVEVVIGIVVIAAGLAALVAPHAAEQIELEAYLDGAAASGIAGQSLRSRTGNAPVVQAAVRYIRAMQDRIVALDGRLAAADAMLEALPLPMLVVDGARRVIRTNNATDDVLGGDVVGRNLSVALRQPQVLGAVDAVLGGHLAQDVEFSLAGEPVARKFIARVVRLGGAAADDAGAVIVLHDLTLAKRSEQMRADFVANVSHELRTPLASLLGFIETLQGPAKDDAEAHERFLAIMQDQALRMNRLVDDLLSLSRIELSEHTPPQDRVDAAEIVARVAAALKPVADARRIAIAVDAQPPACVVGDRDQLAQVFQNLIENAIKYGRDDSAVEVRLRAHRSDEAGGGRSFGSLQVAVRDSGMGIAREHLPRLTERFYRVDTARSRSLGGTGLGLAIVKHIVNRHRGSLTIESELGKGSTFTVVLPLAPDVRGAGDSQRPEAPQPAAGPQAGAS